MTHRCSINASCRQLNDSRIAGYTGPRTDRLACTVSRAFSLVELLVVIGIIALLVGILLPSLNSARTESKRSTVKQLLASIDRGLEVFNTDFKQYPNSSLRPDPVKMAAGESVSSPVYLNGAHWLARAMVGHDGQGLDFGARSLEGAAASYDASVEANDPFISGRMYSKRRGSYIQKAVYDLDTQVGANNPLRAGPQTGRIVLKDVFEFPIIYYRANTKAPAAFCMDGTNGGTLYQGAPGDVTGKYTLNDNWSITGAYSANAQPPASYTRVSNDPDKVGWALVNTEEAHGLGVFGSIKNPKDRSASVSPASPAPVGRYFTDFLSDGNALKLGVVKPVNETTFILISAGPDGLFGTPDDVTNFK